MAQIDLQRFMQTFLDESREGLDAMEQGLLRLEQGHGDAETINTIFRAAHSIKGGAGTFGLADITRVTHLLETLLDEMRSGRRAAGADESAVLLRSVDVLRDMLDAAQAGSGNDVARVASLTEALERILGEACAAHSAPNDVAASATQTWLVRFAPKPELLKSGNDPLRILAELAGLGTLKVECDVSRLPAFAALEPETAYLAWRMELVTAAPQARIEEAFAWVVGDCDLELLPQRPVLRNNILGPRASARGAMQTLFTFTSPPTACGYLPDRVWSLRYDVAGEITPAEYAHRMRAGWRRFGFSLFQPQCPACTQCRSLRVRVAHFRPNQSQKRTAKLNRGEVAVRVGEPAVTKEKLALYDKFHAFQTESKGWPEHAPETVTNYIESFVENPFPTQEWCYYLGDRLVGVGYVDVLPVGLSAIYFYYDPAERDRSLGTWNVLSILEKAAELRLPHVYLGFFVEGCRSLEYKAKFRPNETLQPDGSWRPFVT